MSRRLEAEMRGRGLAFRIQDSEFRNSGLGVQGLGVRVSGVGVSGGVRGWDWRDQRDECRGS